jgi:hypothetical protein
MRDWSPSAPGFSLQELEMQQLLGPWPVTVPWATDIVCFGSPDDQYSHEHYPDDQPFHEHYNQLYLDLNKLFSYHEWHNNSMWNVVMTVITIMEFGPHSNISDRQKFGGLNGGSLASKMRDLWLEQRLNQSRSFDPTQIATDLYKLHSEGVLLELTNPWYVRTLDGFRISPVEDPNSTTPTLKCYISSWRDRWNGLCKLEAWEYFADEFIEALAERGALAGSELMGMSLIKAMHRDFYNHTGEIKVTNHPHAVSIAWASKRNGVTIQTFPDQRNSTPTFLGTAVVSRWHARVISPLVHGYSHQDMIAHSRNRTLPAYLQGDTDEFMCCLGQPASVQLVQQWYPGTFCDASIPDPFAATQDLLPLPAGNNWTRPTNEGWRLPGIFTVDTDALRQLPAPSSPTFACASTQTMAEAPPADIGWEDAHAIMCPPARGIPAAPSGDTPPDESDYNTARRQGKRRRETTNGGSSSSMSLPHPSGHQGEYAGTLPPQGTRDSSMSLPHLSGQRGASWDPAQVQMPIATGGKGEPCWWHWRSNYGCLKGAECTFSHTRPPLPPVHPLAQAYDVAWDSTTDGASTLIEPAPKQLMIYEYTTPHAQTRVPAL